MSTIIQKWLKLFFGLCLLKPETVEECFVFDIFADAPENENAIMFADYVVNTYIDDSATFLREIWADPDMDIKRSMNGCESSKLTSISTIGEHKVTDKIF